MPVGQEKDGTVKKKTFDGESYHWDYVAPDDVTDVQLSRNFESELPSAGFRIDFEEKPDLIVANKGDTWIKIETHTGFYYQTIVFTGEALQKSDLDPAAIADALAERGHIALYGVHFEPNTATIQPDSEHALQQTLKYLKDNPDETLRVVGYTDNTLSYDDNLKLSEDRAKAIVAWLVDQGVDKSRLSAKGFGEANPVAENTTEEGRAQNQRVELVKP